MAHAVTTLETFRELLATHRSTSCARPETAERLEELRRGGELRRLAPIVWAWAEAHLEELDEADVAWVEEHVRPWL